MKQPLTTDKYLSKHQAQELRRTAEERAIIDREYGRKTWDKVWMLIDLATCTGMRVSEMAALKINEIHLGHDPLIYVRKGKGGKDRNILIDKESTLKKHIKTFVARYRLNEDDYLLNVAGKAYSTMGLQKQFTKAAKEAGLPPHYSIHCLRHTYATYLYDKKKDLRMVQQQLGHSDPSTTAIYAQATKEAVYESLAGLYD